MQLHCVTSSCVRYECRCDAVNKRETPFMTVGRHQGPSHTIAGRWPIPLAHHRHIPDTKRKVTSLFLDHRIAIPWFCVEQTTPGDFAVFDSVVVLLRARRCCFARIFFGDRFGQRQNNDGEG